MLLSEQSLRLSRRLYRMRRALPLLGVIASVGVMVSSRPFGMIRESLIFSTICVAVSVVGVIIRSVGAGSTPPFIPLTDAETTTQGARETSPLRKEGASETIQEDTQEETQESTQEGTQESIQAGNNLPLTPIEGGIYSVIRHPQTLGNLLIFLGLLLYTGVWGWIGVMAVVLFWLGEKLTTYHETAYLKRYGAPYRSWAERTSAFVPRRNLSLLFKKSHRSSAHKRLRALQRGWLTLAILYPALLLIRLQLIEFTLEPPLYWIIIEGALLALWITALLGSRLSKE